METALALLKFAMQVSFMRVPSISEVKRIPTYAHNG